MHKSFTITATGHVILTDKAGLPKCVSTTHSPTGISAPGKKLKMQYSESWMQALHPQVKFMI